VAEKFRSFSEPGQKISAEPTALTASTESAPEPVFLPADNTRTPPRDSAPSRAPPPPQPRVAGRAESHHGAAEATKGPRRACRIHSASSPAPEATSDSDSPSDRADNPLSSPWPVPSHCEGTPAIPLSPFSSWPVPSHCEGTPAIPLSPFLPGPFLPIAREPRPSRFLLFSWPVPSHCEGTPAIPLSPFFLARSFPLRGNPGHPAFSFFFLARSFPLRGNPGRPAFSFSSWPVPSHCEGTPAIPLSPFSSWPVPSHCEGTPAIPLSPFLPGPFLPIAREPRPSRFLLFLPGPFLPIAREPRPSRFLLFLPGPFLPIAREPRPSRFLLFFLARSFPLRGNSGHPAFSFFPGPFLPIAREPRLSRFLLFLPGPFLPIAREPRPSRFLLFFLARSFLLRGNPGHPAFSFSSWPVPSHCEGTPAIPLSSLSLPPFRVLTADPRTPHAPRSYPGRVASHHSRKKGLALEAYRDRPERHQIP
jgi:hypothetical protein